MNQETLKQRVITFLEMGLEDQELEEHVVIEPSKVLGGDTLLCLVKQYDPPEARFCRSHIIGRFMVKVTPLELEDTKLCPQCKEQKPGWPLEWANFFEDKRTLYVCAACTIKREEPDGD